MAKYILKQEAIFALTNEANTHSNPVKRAYTRAAALIEQITAEDVQPVKRGKWNTHNVVKVLCSGKTLDGFCQCTACGDVFSLHYSDYNYCPNCGADMTGGTDND